MRETLDADEEALLLEPFVAAYERRFGRRLELERDELGLLLRFPVHDTPSYREAIGRVDVLGSHPAVRSYLSGLGFRWNEESILDGVPSPGSFLARAPESGSRPRYYLSSSYAMSKRAWLEGNLRGEIPLTLATRAFYARLAWRARLPLPERRRRRESIDYHFFGVQHDLTKHLLLTHLVPRALLLELGDELSRGLRAWHRGPLVAAPLVRFYENDLLHYCQQIWRDLRHPDDFAPTCLAKENVAQLWRVVEARLEEVAQGPRYWLGDDADTCAEFRIVRDRL